MRFTIVDISPQIYLSCPYSELQRAGEAIESDMSRLGFTSIRRLFHPSSQVFRFKISDESP